MQQKPMYLECYKEKNPRITSHMFKQYDHIIIEMLSIRRKSSNNQSINQSINQLVIPSHNDISSKCNCVTQIPELFPRLDGLQHSVVICFLNV